jgi:hypothetical protein
MGLLSPVWPDSRSSTPRATGKIALEDCRVVPGRIGEGRGHDVLGQAVQAVRQLAAARWPPRGEPLVASPAQQEGPGGQHLIERELGKLRAIF